MIDLTGKPIVLCGDIHGEFRELTHKITVDLDLHDTTVIVCGDCGFGFEKKNYYLETVYNRIKDRLEKNNNDLLFFRGNHDDPSYFNGDNKIDLPHFKTLPDYEIINSDKGDILIVGGATSIDRDNRKELMKDSSKVIWWENERPIKKDLQDFSTTIKVVLSHEAPIQLDPVVSRMDYEPLDLYQNVIKDRDYLGKLLVELKPSYWYYGHHHRNYSGTWGNTLWRCLGIMNLCELCGGY